MIEGVDYYVIHTKVNDSILHFKFLTKTNYSAVIIDNFYSEDELKLIWRELDFLTDKFLPGKLTQSTFNDKGESKSNSGIFLDQVYSNRNFSNILKINRKIYNQNITSELIGMNPIFRVLLSCNFDTSLLSYYENGDSYHSHTDSSSMTVLSYFHKEPQKFSGGELILNDFDLKILPKNNRIIMFPGCYSHEVLEVSLDNKSGNYGRYSMTQFLNYR